MSEGHNDTMALKLEKRDQKVVNLQAKFFQQIWELNATMNERKALLDRQIQQLQAVQEQVTNFQDDQTMLQGILTRIQDNVAQTFGADDAASNDEEREIPILGHRIEIGLLANREDLVGCPLLILRS